MTTDVWPNLDWSKAIRTPRTVLLEQSDLLQKKSKGALTLIVQTGSRAKSGHFPDGSFRYDASIHSAPLSYHMGLLVVEHSMTNPYPAVILEVGDKNETQVENEEQFITALREILSRPKWVEAIDRLIAMGNSR